MLSKVTTDNANENNSYNNKRMSAQLKYERYKDNMLNSAFYSSSNNNNNNVNNNEKFHINNNNNGHQYNVDRERTLEQPHKQSVQFTTAQEFESNGCDVAIVNANEEFSDTRYACSNCKRLPSTDHVYENLPAYALSASKEFLLEKYFRSDARTQAIYQNLCRGCGYGVFASQGDLCNFCECIVSGGVPQSGSLGDKLNANIYENICEHCGRLYASAECVCRLETPLISDLTAAKSRKLHKSKSFGKRDKRSIFHGLFGTLRGAQSGKCVQTKSGANRTLEIVHHVDGHENVFRTQETFDLQRICELKRTQTSCSEQHIYGRLKANDAQQTSAQTLPPLTRQQSAGQATSLPQQPQQKSGKRPRISKPSLLRIKSQSVPLATPPHSEQLQPAAVSAQALYLNESICMWMNALRQQVHEYDADCWRTCCYPKSIPGRGDFVVLAKPATTIASLAPNELLTNCENSDKLTQSDAQQQQQHAKQQQQRSFTNSARTLGDTDEGYEQQVAIEQMISEFKRQMVLKNNNNSNNSKPNNNTTHTGSNSNSTANTGNNNMSVTEPLNSDSVQRNKSAAPLTEQPNMRSAELSSSRCKRQAIYLKNLDLTAHNNNNAKLTEPVTATERSLQITARERTEESLTALASAQTTARSISAISSANNSNNNHNNNSNSDSEQSAKQLAAGAAHVADLAQLVSRRAIHEVITTVASNQRYGIYERNSEFVNDILKAFDTFLQSDTANLQPATHVASTSFDSVAEQASGKEFGFGVCARGNAASERIVQSENTESVFVCGEKSKESERGANESAATAGAASVVSDASGAPAIALDTKSITLISPAWARDSLGSLRVPAIDNDICYDSCKLLATATPTTTATATATEEFVQIFDLHALITRQLLSFSLNRCVLSYDKCLSAFLRAITNYNNKCNNNNHNNNDIPTACYQRQPQREHVTSRYSRAQLIGKFHKFYAYCQAHCSQLAYSHKNNKNNNNSNNNKNYCLTTISKVTDNPRAVCASAPYTERQSASVCAESEINQSKNHNNNNNNHKYSALRQVPSEISVSASETNEAKLRNNLTVTAESGKQRPLVPQRDPKTALTKRSQQRTPPLPVKKLESQLAATTTTTPTKPNMTVPKSTPSTEASTTTNTTAATASTASTATAATVSDATAEECIYQPIWQFKTVGEAQERYETDADYYELSAHTKAAVKSLHLGDADAAAAYDSAVTTLYDIEDNGEWETDDEFMFATHTQAESLRRARRRSCSNELNGTLRSTHSASSASGSTVTGFASSTATLASVVSVSLKHPLLRSIGIFFSTTDPKMRAIVYDYERNQASTYFARHDSVTTLSHYDSGELHAHSNDSGLGRSPAKQQDSPIPPPRTTSVRSACQQPKPTERTKPPSKFQLLPDSVLAWQFMLLDVSYLEDEEDMIVSESEILRAQEIKDDIDTRPTQQLNMLQRFKSASIGNLIDLPVDDDKKSLKERMRNKFQRGVLKLNVRSPKSDKKNRGIFRRAEATSLYLEDGMKPKYPIFGAPLEQLELNRTTAPHVPRFVVDCIEYIEREDCIEQDGLYRASGNKVSIDELKQKLSESYIYDPKLLITDDIHTLTSLLKQFFRELGAPLIPQTVYKSLPYNLNDSASIEHMRIAFDEMLEPNRSTLKFLIKHLTNVAAHSSANRMPASNLAIVWGPCLLSANQIEFDIGRMNTLAKVLIEQYARIFAANDNERLVS